MEASTSGFCSGARWSSRHCHSRVSLPRASLDQPRDLRLRSATDHKVHLHGATPQESQARHHHHTLDLINQRHLSGSLPGKRTDGFKLGLVVEGGGMQGIISAAMLHQILLMGLRPCFDAVYGASAGALNASFFLAGQPRGLDIYTEELTDGQFLDLTQMLPRALQILVSRSTSPKPSRYAMDLDFLFGHVMRHKIPLDYQAVISSPVPLKVVVSSLDALKPLILDNFRDDKDLAECLAASCAVPEVAGPPRLVRGHRCVDAAVFEPVPVASAIKDGCTHILFLSTRTSASIAGGSQTAPMARATKRAVITAVKKTLLNAPYMKEAWSCGYSSNDGSDEEILSARETGQAHRLGAYVYGVYPRSLRGVHPVCTNVATLRAARAEGYQSIRLQIGKPLGLRRNQSSKVLLKGLMQVNKS